MVSLPPSLVEIIGGLRAQLAAGATLIELVVPDPDRGRGRHAGEVVDDGGERFVHRPFRLWVDLAERLGLRLLTPRPRGTQVVLRFELLDRAATWDADVPHTERYGASSGYARIAKHEDPGFVLDLADALARIAPAPGARVLDLGVNDGDELALMIALAPALADASFVGVDHSESALAAARARLPDARFRFLCADLGALDRLGLGEFDLVVSLNTLQSPGVDDRALLRRLVQDHLAPGGAILLGLPNARYLDGEIEYGARMKNFRQPELGLLIKDVAFYRKYLQQHDRQVFVTGKHCVLVTAVPIRG